MGDTNSGARPSDQALPASPPEPASGLSPSGNDPSRLTRKRMPMRRTFGSSEIWRDDCTGTWDLYLFGCRIWRSHFTHSTWVSSDDMGINRNA